MVLYRARGTGLVRWSAVFSHVVAAFGVDVGEGDLACGSFLAWMCGWLGVLGCGCSWGMVGDEGGSGKGGAGCGCR